MVIFFGGRNRGTRRKPPTLLQVTDELFHIMWHQVHLAWAGFELTTLVVIDTDCIGSCKSNYHTITITTAPIFIEEVIVDPLYHYHNSTWKISK